MTQGIRKSDGRTGRGYSIQSFAHDGLFDWTCPQCSTRNINYKWLGRRYYNCSKCGHQSNVKNPNSIGEGKTTMEITIL